MFLTPDKLKALTGCQKWSAQRRRLNEMGLNHKLRPDGFPLVLESYIEKSFGGTPKRDKPEMGPVA